MKKLFFMSMLLCITLVMTAQNYELYKCSETELRSKVNNTWGEWKNEKADFILRLCPKEMKLEFNNKAESVFYFVKMLSSTVETDEDGDEFNRNVWSGYDQNGLKCTLVDLDWKKFNDRHFSLKYLDVQVTFGCIIINQESSDTQL